jgi:hypothetical protein
LYLVQRLPPARAQRLADALASPVERAVAQGVVAQRQGRREGARRRVREALQESPRHPTARAVLLRLSARQIQEGADPETFVAPPLDEVERAVVEGWRAVEAEAVRALRALEPALAALPPRHPLLAEASRVRVRWRLASGDPELAREALPIADRALASAADPSDELLRARACVIAGDFFQALDTLSNLALRLRARQPGSAAFAREGLRLAQEIPAEPGLEEMRSRVVRALEARLRQSARR